MPFWGPDGPRGVPAFRAGQEAKRLLEEGLSKFQRTGR